jgi:CopG family nickel-responsive transcriptional regulator
LIADRGYTNRSEAFRKSWQAADTEVIGTVTVVYNHHVRLLSEKLTDLQHDHHKSILSTVHVHLDHDNCLEVLLVKGKGLSQNK